MAKEMKLLIENVRQYAEGYESPSRYKHSVRVAKTAKKISKHFDLNSKQAYFVGLAHDLCKEMSSGAIMNFAKTDGLPISDIEKNKPALLHGRAAAVVVQSFFHVKNDEIIEAIRYHTFGKPNMCALAKVLYVADKVEPNRPQVTKVYYKKLFAMDLDSMVKSILHETIDYLNAKNKPISTSTIDFLHSLETV